MDLDPKYLRAFRAVAECGSFTAAGKMLGMTQSAISQHIRTLEEELGATLLIRSNKLAGLTPAGEIFLQSVRQILDQLDRARSMVREYSGGGGGRLRIGAPSDACGWLLPPIISELHRRLPKTELVVRAAHSATNQDRLVASGIDFALLPNPAQHHSLAMVQTGRDELVLLARPDHPLARRDSLAAAELRDQPMILTSHSKSDPGLWHDLMIEGGVFPKVAVETDSLELAKRLVVNGIGLTIAPRWAALAEVGRGELCAVSFGRAGLWRNWYIAYPQANAPTGPGRVFLGICGEMLPRLFAARSGAGHIDGRDQSDAERTGGLAARAILEDP